jgi:hypothetical protein
MRGHGSLLGACDVTNLVEKIGKLHTITLTDANDAPEGAKIVFGLESVDLHVDPETGIVTTAPIVVPHAGELPKAAKRQKLTDKQQLALEALQSLIAESGEKPPPSLRLPRGITVVGLGAWKEELYRRGVLERESVNPTVYFQRLRDQLKGRHLIAELDLLVWTV